MTILTPRVQYRRPSPGMPRAAVPACCHTRRHVLCQICLALLGGTLATSLAFTPALAFTPNDAFSPSIVLPFSGTEGTAPGAFPSAPPVYIARDQRLYGTSDRGGYSYVDTSYAANGYDEGGAVLYSLDPAAPTESFHAFRAQGELGTGASLLPFWDETTQLLYSGTSRWTDPDSGNSGLLNYTGRLYGLRPDASGDGAPSAVTLPQPRDATLAASPSYYKPNGQAAVDSQGYAYFGATHYYAQCFASLIPVGVGWHTELESANRGLYNLLYRVKLGDANAVPEPVIDFCDFAESYVFPPTRATSTARGQKREYHAKGSQPSHLLIGDDGQSLYGISYVATSSNAFARYNQPTWADGSTLPEDYVFPDYGIPSSDNTGIPVAALFRVALADLQNGKLAADDADKITILHWFAQDRDGGRPYFTTLGSPYIGGDLATINTILEVGDWIYGTNNGIWRYYKGSDTSVTERFQLLHTFGADTAIDSDGTQPSGPLALAADGNLYGTTYGDARNTSAGTQADTGTLYRLVIDHDTPNARPVYEPLQYLDLDTVGARPVGLAIGDAADGNQRLYGATRLSANAADASTPLEHGAIFSLDVPLPKVFTQDLTASAPQIGAGDTLTLSWKAEHAASCTATGNNSGLWNGKQALDGSHGVRITLTQIGSYTFGLSCVRSFGGPDAEAATVTVTVTAASGNNSDDTDSGGSGGGGALGGLALFALALSGLRRPQRN